MKNSFLNAVYLNSLQCNFSVKMVLEEKHLQQDPLELRLFLFPSYLQRLRKISQEELQGPPTLHSRTRGPVTAGDVGRGVLSNILIKGFPIHESFQSQHLNANSSVLLQNNGRCSFSSPKT